MGCHGGDELMSKYIRFELVAHKPKTDVYDVISRRHGDVLGQIKWYALWRQYCFFPADSTVWNRGCLQHVQEFLLALMVARKEKKEKKGE
jgi:hypothetical protein